MLVAKDKGQWLNDGHAWPSKKAFLGNNEALDLMKRKAT